ncbi:hypothetical protein F4804DRAFT_104758 [Jackrogersella minutella]|nr:hypothetical protein F4804DRAFT_104758 [Jackrogersella minutella]
MAKRTNNKVPDAWEDDDWEVQADKAVVAEEQGTEPQTQPQLSKAERLAQHAESNRKLWESAEAPPDTFHYLAARSDPPLATGFKPAVKVLSRKPVQDHGGDDSDEDKKAPQLTPEEIQAKQQRELEDKQRRYDEARAKIFGTTTGSNPSSGTSTPGAVTPPRSADGRGPRGRGRGGRGGAGVGVGGGGGHRYNESRGDRDNNPRPSSQSGGGQLYDPNYAAKPGVQPERRGNNYNNDGGAPLFRRPTPREEDQVIRAPRGPDGSGRGGFGFAKRGARDS